jgi:hypothetical protein
MFAWFWLHLLLELQRKAHWIRLLLHCAHLPASGEGSECVRQAAVAARRGVKQWEGRAARGSGAMAHFCVPPLAGIQLSSPAETALSNCLDS